MRQHTRATLYYDGQCNLCAFEIDKLKTLSSDDLTLVDIHGLDNTAALPDKSTMLKQLHLRDKNGNWMTGVDATVAAWSYTRIGALWKPLTWPMISKLADYCYAYWAENRFQRLYGKNQPIDTRLR